MKALSLKHLAEIMKAQDFCMMLTADGRGTHHSRPMSNNRDVDYDGTTWFFTYEDSNKVRQIEGDAKVTLTYQGKDFLFVSCYGHAGIIRQKSMMADHWMDSLSQWFPQGLETPGICMVKVVASQVQVWDKDGEHEWKPA